MNWTNNYSREYIGILLICKLKLGSKTITVVDYSYKKNCVVLLLRIGGSMKEDVLVCGKEIREERYTKNVLGEERAALLSLFIGIRDASSSSSLLSIPRVYI